VTGQYDQELIVEPDAPIFHVDDEAIQACVLEAGVADVGVVLLDVSIRYDV
jgi:hypothetical protein